MGGIKFKNYIAKRVSGTVHVEAADHPAFQGVAPDFVIDEEEWYTFDKNPRPNVHVLANVDEASYTPEANVNNVTMGDHPVVWSNEKMKARNIYFLMGHHPSLMKNENFVKLLGNSILWCAEKNQK
jgi:type 1 glutamine amidotransferase